MTLAKQNVWPHTQAKLNVFRNYLDKYLAILSASRWVNQVYIFDIFCGTGIYNDGKAGSPIIAHDIVGRARALAAKYGWPDTSVTLHVNDVNPRFVEKVQKYLEGQPNHHLTMKFSNLDANLMLDYVRGVIEQNDSHTRSLIFIDPYGYKEIYKSTLVSLLENNSTEVMLFLPVSHMYRFIRGAVQDEDNPGYAALRRFIFDFFPSNHRVRKGHLEGVFDLIDQLEKAFSFNDQIFSTSFRIQRDRSNYYAVFTMTPNLLGFEKIVDVLWELDPMGGQGHYLERVKKSDNPEQGNLLDALDYTDAHIRLSRRMSELEALLTKYVLKSSKGISNGELTVLLLKNGFKSTHATPILRELQKEEKIQVWDLDKNEQARKNSFYLGTMNMKESGHHVNISGKQ